MNKLFSRVTIGFGVLVLLSIAGGSAYADGIVLVAPNHSKLVPPLAALNLQHHGNSTVESGGVRWDGSSDVSFGDISAGPHQHTVAFSSIGTSASNLQILFNINEANGGNKSPLTIDSLLLTAYDQNGNSVFTADLAAGPLTLEQIRGGQGANADYALGLDSAAAARLQAAVAANPNLRLGLTATLSDVHGGPERFSFSGSAGNEPVPEPATMVLLGTGLAGVAGAVRRRRKAAKAVAEADQG
ncbi:MAG: PEP-CTERM sorting domain-containing protein [Pyrinomonadaceae bacterium]